MKKIGLLVGALALAAMCGFQPVQAGARDGLGVNRTSVNPLETDVYRVVFRAGETAEVIVDGQRITDLDLYVRDANGGLVAMDEDDTSYCVVHFVPTVTQVYTIRVVNRGPVANRYTIRHN